MPVLPIGLGPCAAPHHPGALGQSAATRDHGSAAGPGDGAGAQLEGDARGRKLRIDSTRRGDRHPLYPTDTTLLFDGVRVLSRLLQRATAALTGRPPRIGARRIREAKRLVRRIEATAAVHATAADRAERPGLYRRLLELTQTSVRQAEQAQRALAARSEEGAQRLASAVRSVAPLVQQVIAQAERRVLRGETVPAADKLVSLFEAHTAIIRRGNAHLAAEFGRKVMLDEVDGGLVTHNAVLVGNPLDATGHHPRRGAACRSSPVKTA